MSEAANLPRHPNPALTCSLLLFVLACFSSVPARASCTDLEDGVSTISASTITLDVQGADEVYESDAVDAGVNLWNSECQGEIPSFTRTTGGDLAITLEFTGHKSPSDSQANDYCSGKCGCFNPMHSTVYIHREDINDTDCSTYYTALVAHELGHVLGLADVDGCTGSLMGDQLQIGLQVTENECGAVDDLWLTEIEKENGLPEEHPCQNPPA